MKSSVIFTTVISAPFEKGKVYCYNNALVVLCTNPDVKGNDANFDGIVLHDNQHINPVGSYSNGWRKEVFKPFKGQINLFCE
jgi:hypothetical protein